MGVGHDRAAGVDAGDLQARIAGLLESIVSAATGVGFLIGGVVTAITSPPTAFAVSGVGVIVLVALGGIFRVIPDTRGAPLTSAPTPRRAA